uniref:Solute carrier family 2 member 11b n=1 Tax=Latimeria chalumnae TaxID=7897 RepID=H3BDJ3_LATCH
MAIFQFPNKTLFLATFAAGIGGTFQYGYNVSVISAPTKYVQRFINETWEARHGSRLGEDLLTLLWSIIASIFTFGGFIGAHVGGTMAIRIGRKGTLLANNILALAASLLMGISYPTGLFELIILGRFLIGISAGVSICTQPLYLGEIASKPLRGAMAMGTSVFLTAGILIGQIVGLRELLGGEMYWPILLSTSCVPASIQLCTLPWFPESPRYLLIDRNDELKCVKALKHFHGTSNYHIEMDDIQKEQITLQGEKPKKFWQLFTDQTVKWQLITIIIMNMGQQFSGINAIYFYANYVFTRTGIPAENIPYITVGTGACECLTALTCGFLIENLGRRILIIGGYSLMALWCIVLTITLTYQSMFVWMPYMSMACVFAFILSFGLGPGGVTNVLTAELFTQLTRPAAYTIGGSVNWLSFFTIGILFPFIVNGLKQYCFLVFLVACSLVATFIFFVIPETKNKSFIEIKTEFIKKNMKAINKEEGLVENKRMLKTEC